MPGPARIRPGRFSSRISFVLRQGLSSNLARQVHPRGFRELFILMFLHVGTRRMFITQATAHPTAAWTRKQAQLFSKHIRGRGLKFCVINRALGFGQSLSFGACW